MKISELRLLSLIIIRSAVSGLRNQIETCPGIHLCLSRVVQLVKNNLLNNLAYKRKIWYRSVVAQYGFIKIALVQEGLNDCGFQGVCKHPPQKSEAFTTSNRSSTPLKKDVGSVSG